MLYWSKVRPEQGGEVVNPALVPLQVDLVPRDKGRRVHLGGLDGGQHLVHGRPRHGHVLLRGLDRRCLAGRHGYHFAQLAKHEVVKFRLDLRHRRVQTQLLLWLRHHERRLELLRASLLLLSLLLGFVWRWWGHDLHVTPYFGRGVLTGQLR